MLRLRAASQASAKLAPSSLKAATARRIQQVRPIHGGAASHQPSREGGSGRSARSSNVEASPAGSSSSSSSSSSSAEASSSSSSAAAADAAANAARAYTRSLYDPRQRSAHWLRAASSNASSSSSVGASASGSSGGSSKSSSPGSGKPKPKPSVKLSDKRSSSIEQYRVEEKIPSGGAQQKGEGPTSGADGKAGAGVGAGAGASTASDASGPNQAASSTGPTTTSEDLLKQRLRQEQERFERRTMPVGQNEAVLVSAGYGARGGGMGGGSSQSAAGAGGSGAAGNGGSGEPPPPSSPEGGVVEGSIESAEDQGQGQGSSGPGGNLESRSIRPPRLENPFDSHRFVQRLLEGGFVPRLQKVMEEAGAAEEVARRIGTEEAKMADAAEGDEGQQLAEGELLDRSGAQLQAARRYDPAEAIMEAVRHLIVSRYERVIDLHMNKTQVENESYLFSAALSELRTELQVRARNDATALRSITTLLQREVDALDQKMREDINTLKHDIQVDMNNRKGESKEEQNSLEQEIQDLNNRFTISISDLKTEIEQNIKWDATRRALTLVFGIAIIAVATLVLAEYLGRDDAGGAEAGGHASNLPPGVQGPNAAKPTTVGGRPNSSSPSSHAAAAGGRVSSDSTDSSTYDALLDLADVRPKSAEELGLVPKYEDAEAGRYV